MLSRHPLLKCFSLLCIGLLAFGPSGCGTSLPPDPPEPSGSTIDRATVIDNISSSTWGVAVRLGEVEPLFITFGTAFAVDGRRLVTNAHVADAILGVAPELLDDQQIGVVQHETGIFVAIEEVWTHPDYDPDFFISTPDVAVLSVDTLLATHVTLASDTEISTLSVLDSISLCGFPGDVTLAIDLALGSSRPRVTCLTGSVSALRPFDPSDPALPSNTFLVQHDIQTSGGTSGGAVFDDAGRVIAVNNAATIDDSSSNRFAIRIDLVRSFLDDIDDGLVGSVLLEQFVGTASEADSVQCPSSRYRNDEFDFGFDPPLGFSGPLPVDNPLDSELFSGKFEESGFINISFSVTATNRSQPEAVDYQKGLLAEIGYVLVSEEDFLTSSGSRATILTTRLVPIWIDMYGIQLISVSNGLRYRFGAGLSPADFFSLGNEITDSIRSFCAD